MSLPAILLPLFVQVALTFFLGFWMTKERFQSGVSSEEARLYPVRWPEKAQKVGNSFHNQFEMPLFFYVLVVLALITQKADLLFVLLSWVFVVSRLVHAFIHTTSNIVKWRGMSYVVGVFVLLAMWVIFAVRILL